MPLRLKRADLDRAIEALLIAAKTATTHSGLRVTLPGANWKTAERHVCAAIALMAPHLDTVIPEDVEFFSVGPMFPTLRGKTKGNVTELEAGPVTFEPTDGAAKTGAVGERTT